MHYNYRKYFTLHNKVNKDRLYLETYYVPVVPIKKMHIPFPIIYITH